MLLYLHLKDPALQIENSCVLCQVDTKAALDYSARSMKPNFGTGYKSLAEHLMQF